jgi:hypothetical protein
MSTQKIIIAIALSSVSLSLLSTGCTDSEGDAVFVGKSEKQLQSVVLAATGAPLEIAAQSAAMLASFDPAGACPKIKVEGSKRTIEGGCTDGSATYAGTVVLENVAGVNGEADASKPSVATFINYEYKENDGTHSSVNGKITTSVSKGVKTIDGDIQLAIQENKLANKSLFTCAADGLCKAVNSLITVPDVGTAIVTGSWRLFENDAAKTTGIITITGADVLALDLDRDAAPTGTKGACVATTLNGKAGTICFPES